MNGTWTRVKDHTVHTASGIVVADIVNSICWAPHEYGLMLAAGSSDGKISILTYKGIRFILYNRGWNMGYKYI